MKVGNFPAWQAARACTGRPEDGARALMSWVLKKYGDEGAYNLGIYNCRTVRGGYTTSMHGEGRAIDVGVPVGGEVGRKILRRLIKRVGSLGIQAIIFERKIYSAKSPEGRYYGGVNPHYDHLHIEMTREAADKLTYKRINQILSPKVHRPGSRPLKQGKRGRDVRYVQRFLGLKVDGIFGPKTAEAVREHERKLKTTHPKLKADGYVGTTTWHTLGIKTTY